MSRVDKLLQDIRELPSDFRVKGKLGSGPASRPVSADSDECQKIVIEGDDRWTILMMLGYLLWDLAADCGWSDAEREALTNEIYGETEEEESLK